MNQFGTFGRHLKVFEVGGFVRDKFMDIPDVKDLDFAVEADSFDVMTRELELLGFRIFKSDPQFVTLRAQFPRNTPWAEFLTNRDLNSHLTADFVLCRKDGEYTDGRRPATVEKGDIFDDLARRDFTVNAIAQDVDTREIFDPWEGTQDCVDQVLRFVGNPLKRIEEDGLRVLRGLRFIVTRDLEPDWLTQNALRSAYARNAVTAQNTERIFEEVRKMFQHDTPKAILTLNEFEMLDTVFPKSGPMWLLPTMKGK